MTIDRSDKHIMTYIEFPLLIKERFLYILLQNEGFGGTIMMPATFFQDAFYLIQG